MVAVIDNASRLKSLRLALDWSQLHMGQELGLDGDAGSIRSRVHAMETGTRAITGPIAKLICHIAKHHDIEL